MNDQPLNALKTPSGAPTDAAAAPEEEPASRRKALRTLGKLGFGAALLGAGSFLSPRVAQAQGMDGDAPTALEILNFALTLEYLERSFYNQGVDSGVIPGDAMPVFELIRDHERKHVDYLRGEIQDADGEPVMFEDSDFDFTAGNGDGDGPFDPFNNYDQFLLLAQGFEDTGVRAYKGQAANILGSTYLEPALRIHSLEARHAAEVRRLRDMNGADVKPWIVLGSVDDESPIAAVYGPGMAPAYAPDRNFPPEENVVQAGVDLTMDLQEDYSAEDASAAFDEPLDMQTVLNIADPFIPGDQGTPDAVTLDFSSSNAPFGVLNYAYALEQLEAAFYGQARQSSFDDETMDVLNDLWDHERAHRDFFEAKITDLGGTPLPGLTPDFSMVDFSDKSSVLQTALTFEDLGVSAYNGAASLIGSANPLMAAGEIVSVEARHAAALRDLMDPSDNYLGGTFVLDDEYVIDANGLDEAASPSAVLGAAQPFIKNEINTTGLPSDM